MYLEKKPPAVLLATVSIVDKPTMDYNTTLNKAGTIKLYLVGLIASETYNKNVYDS